MSESRSVSSSSPRHDFIGDQVVILPLRHEGVFMAKGRENALCTKNLVPGKAVYNEELISVQNDHGTEVQYRVWSPSTSNLAAVILCGVDNIWIARFVSLNAVHYLKVGGHYLITLKRTDTSGAAFPACIEISLREQFNPMEQVTLEQFKKDHVCYLGGFRMPSEKKA